jgi:hypothetical protein
MRCLAGLFVGNRPGSLSLGRITLWLVFIPALVMWLRQKDITQSHFEFLVIIVGYNLGSKFIKSLKDIVYGLKNVSNNSIPEIVKE